MNNIKLERQRFEAYIASTSLALAGRTNTWYDNEYLDEGLQIRWKVWQARAALEKESAT